MTRRSKEPATSGVNHLDQRRNSSVKIKLRTTLMRIDEVIWIKTLPDGRERWTFSQDVSQVTPSFFGLRLKHEALGMVLAPPHTTTLTPQQP